MCGTIHTVMVGSILSRQASKDAKYAASCQDRLGKTQNLKPQGKESGKDSKKFAKHETTRQGFRSQQPKGATLPGCGKVRGKGAASPHTHSDGPTHMQGLSRGRAAREKGGRATGVLKVGAH
jgi:hypothetical protein